MTRLLNESFVPVLLVFIAIFVLVFYSNYLADIDAAEITLIEIPAVSTLQSEDDDVALEESFSQVEKLRTIDPVYVEAYKRVKNRQWDIAEKEYLLLINKHNTSQARTELGYIYYKQNKYSQAEKQLKKALKLKPTYVAANFYLAKTFKKLERYDEAEKSYQKYIKHFPIHFSAHFNVGMIQLKQQNYLDAVGSFKAASSLAPGRSKSKAMYYLGKSYQKLGAGYYEKALAAYQTSIRVFPGNVKPRMGIASLLSDDEEGRDKAEEIYLQVISLKSNYSPAYLMLAGIYKEQGRIRDAISSYTKAIEYNPSNNSARYNYGLMLLDQKKWTEAADQFHSITRSDKQHAKAYFNLGRANYRLKFYTQALGAYQQALKIKNNDYPEVVVNMGLVYSAKKDYEKAIELYKKALSKNDQSAKLYYNIGLAYSKSKNIKEALDAFKQAIKHRPNYSQAWYNVGLIYGRQDNHQSAIDAYTSALKIKPDYRSAQFNLAVSLKRNNRLKEAEEVYRAVLESNPRYAAAWNNLGLVLMEQGLYSEAEEVLFQALELETNNERVTGYLARSLLRQKKYEDAVKYYRIALDINPLNKKFRLEYVRALKDQGDLMLAKSEIEKAIKLNPDYVALKNELKKINIKLKDKH